MLRNIFLLTPIYVTLFWCIALAGNKVIHSTPRIFLSKFMFFPLIIYICHFLYFSPIPDIYPYFDIVLQFSSLIVFPMYYVYFRLLTVDEKYEWKKHGRYFVPATLITTAYTCAVFLAPKTEFRAWLYNHKAHSESSIIQILNILRTTIRLTYLIQVVITVIANYLLIRKYQEKAEQYYSDIQDGKFNNATALNHSILLMSVAAFAFTALGRDFLANHDAMIYIGWAVFSIVLFIIGFLGIKQKPINPSFETVEILNTIEVFNSMSDTTQQLILNNILKEFEQNKIYLNYQLNIMDLAQIVGSNRTYISKLINQKYNQNFCSFVNNYRLLELESIYGENPQMSDEVLSKLSGFGSVVSMKRAINANKGMSIGKWKVTQSNIS